MSDPMTPERRAELRRLADQNAARTIGKWFASTGWGAALVAIKRTDAHGTHVTITNEMSRTHAELIVAAVNALPELLDALDKAEQAPCVMTHTPPYDFAQCETHDEIFPLGETCRFHERDMIEVLFEATGEQSMRAVRAELERDRAKAALARTRQLVHGHLIGDCTATNALGRAFLAALDGDL